MKGWLKNILIFLAGMAAMFILMLFLAPKPTDELPGLNLFENSTQEKVITAKQIEIFQVIEPNKALAHTTNHPDKIFDPDELLVLIIGDENTSYYDNEKININENQYLKQIGTYQYITKSETQKTVPVVSIVTK